MKQSERKKKWSRKLSELARKRNRKARGLYVCNKCGLRINADVNGTVNILNRYLQPLGRSSANVGLAKVIRWDGNILFEP